MRVRSNISKSLEGGRQSQLRRRFHFRQEFVVLPFEAVAQVGEGVADALMQRITLEAARKAAARSAAARAKREERERATAATQKV